MKLVLQLSEREQRSIAEQRGEIRDGPRPDRSSAW